MTMRMGILAIICMHVLLCLVSESAPTSRKLGSEQMGELASSTDVLANLNHRGLWRKLLEENADKVEETNMEIKAKSDEAEKAEVTDDVKEEPVVAGVQAEEKKLEPIAQKEEEGTEADLKEPQKDEVVKEEANVAAIGGVYKEESPAEVTIGDIKTERGIVEAEKMDTTEISKEADGKETNAQAQEVLKEEEVASGTSEPQSKSSEEGSRVEKKPVESVQPQREEGKARESVQVENEEEKPIESEEMRKEEERPLESAEVQKQEVKPVASGENQKGEEKPLNENVEVLKEEEKPSDESLEVQKEEEEKPGESMEVQRKEKKSVEYVPVQREEEGRDDRIEVQTEDGKPKETLQEHKEEERPVEESLVERAIAEGKQQDASSFVQNSEDVKEEAFSTSTGVAEEEKRENAEVQIQESPSEGGEKKEEPAKEGNSINAVAGNDREKQDELQKENPIKMVQTEDLAGKEQQYKDGTMEQMSEPEEQTMQSSAAGGKIDTSDVDEKPEDKQESRTDDNTELKENEIDSSVTDEAFQVKLDEETQAATKEVESQLELLKRDTALETIDDHRQERVPSDDDYDIIQELADLPTKFQETAGKVADHLRPDVQRWSDTSKEYFNLANQQITESFSPLIGSQYAPFLASMISYGILLLPLIVVIMLFEHIKALLSLQKVLLFINVYLAAYFATLWLASFIIGLEPMSFFYQNNLSSYLSLQLLQALGYVIYLILQTLNILFVCSSDTFTGKLTTILQWIVSIAIGLHYYVTVFHPAVSSKPPHTSWKFYAIYTVAFLVLCLFARIRWVKKQYIAGNDVTSKKS